MQKDNHGADACYDPETEILTAAGWKRFPELAESDKVASLTKYGMRFVEPISQTGDDLV